MVFFIVLLLPSLRQAKANCFLLHVVHFPQKAQTVASGIWRCAILSSINKVKHMEKSLWHQAFRRAGAGLAASAGDKDFIPTMCAPEGGTGRGSAPSPAGSVAMGLTAQHIQLFFSLLDHRMLRVGKNLKDYPVPTPPAIGRDTSH